MEIYNKLSNEYDTFIYEGFNIIEETDYLKIIYDFNVPNLTRFYPTLKLNKFEINEFTEHIIFHIGLIELISYWKATCSKNVIIKAGYITQEQINWFKKLYYNGLGELFYRNNITIDYENFMNIKCLAEKKKIEIPDFKGTGNLIPVGGGKDSNVTLEILKNSFENNNIFIINPKDVTLSCAKVAGYPQEKIFTVERTIDKNLLELNKKGFINGHTPFSALVAFTSFLLAYINNKKYIILSNESSSNEANVINTKINHQYSKSYEFENDFNNYINKYFKIDVKYFSLLRPLNEYQIGLMFSNYKKYHKVFRSCNVGSKTIPWEWCCNCSKCLFVYIMLSPFLYKDKLINIFGEDLFEKKELLNTFIDLIGFGKNKPFDCVGTYQEVRYALSKVINQIDNLPYLLKFYKDNYELENMCLDLEHSYNKENNLEESFEILLKEELNKYV